MLDIHKKKLAVIGRTEMLLDAAKKAEKYGFEVVAIITAKASHESLVVPEDFEALARQLGAEYHYDLYLREEAVDLLDKAKPDVAITMNWPTLISSQIVDIIPHGIINAHGSDLPKYRGNACPNWAILMGEAEIGVSFHMIDPQGLDTGDVVHKRFLANSEDLYISDVYDWLRAEIPDGLVSAARGIVDGTLTPERQSEELAFRGYPRRPDDGRLDVRDNAVRQHALIRASSRPFPGAFCFDDTDHRITVWRATIIRDFPRHLAVPGQILEYQLGKPLVAFGDGVLRFDEFSVEDGHPAPTSIRARFH